MFYTNFTLIILGLVAMAWAHMTMIDPCPRFGAKCINQPAKLPAGAQLDYNMINPIPEDGILCKYSTPWPSPVATWTAGQPITVQFLDNNAAHGGGHAQFSVSYDGGKTFAVVYEVLKYMFFNGPSSSNTPEVLSYTFTLPKDLPSSNNVVFAWSWVNAIGNREFYMNCADVAITGSSSSSYTGKQMVIADHDGYPTIPEFAGNYSTGLSYYEDAPSITVSPSGSSTSGGNSSPSNTSPQVDDPDQAIVNIVTVTTTLDVGDLDQSIINIVTVTAPLTMPTDDSGDDYDTITGTDIGPDTGSNTIFVANSDSSSVTGSGDGNSGSNGNSGGSGCTNGAMNCASGSSGYEVCVWGKIVSMPCGPGTTCKGTGGAIYCGWP